jgi:hypothetical protein
MAKRDLSSILKPQGPKTPDSPPAAASAQPAASAAAPADRPDPTRRLWQLLGRDSLAPKSAWHAEVRYRRLVKSLKGEPPAAVVEALHDELSWAYPRLNGPGRPADPDPSPTDPERVEWEVAALMIERICQQLEVAANTSAAWREAIRADAERRFA